VSDEPQPPFVRPADGTTAEGFIVSDGANRDLRIAGRDLTFIRVDFQTRLQFDEFEVVIECPFVLREGASHVEYRLDPRDTASLAPLLRLYPDALVTADADADATLHLAFASGAAVVVPADERYEAWQVNGPGNFLVVCVPGREGKLAIWS
jgi:hypothetical protein